jgi:hypothetical protein
MCTNIFTDIFKVKGWFIFSGSSLIVLFGLVHPTALALDKRGQAAKN